MHSHTLSCLSSYVHQPWMTHAPPRTWPILRHSQSFPCILTTDMFMHIWHILMHSQAFSWMSSAAYRPKVTHTHPWTWVILRLSQSFSCILITYMLMHIWSSRMHSHAFSWMSSDVYQPRMTHTPTYTWLILMHSQSFWCILIAHMLILYRIV